MLEAVAGAPPADAFPVSRTNGPPANQDGCWFVRLLAQCLASGGAGPQVGGPENAVDGAGFAEASEGPSSKRQAFLADDRAGFAAACVLAILNEATPFPVQTQQPQGAIAASAEPEPATPELSPSQVLPCPTAQLWRAQVSAQQAALSTACSGGTDRRYAAPGAAFQGAMRSGETVAAIAVDPPNTQQASSAPQTWSETFVAITTKLANGHAETAALKLHSAAQTREVGLGDGLPQPERFRSPSVEPVQVPVGQGYGPEEVLLSATHAASTQTESPVRDPVSVPGAAGAFSKHDGGQVPPAALHESPGLRPSEAAQTASAYRDLWETPASQPEPLGPVRAGEGKQGRVAAAARSMGPQKPELEADRSGYRAGSPATGAMVEVGQLADMAGSAGKLPAAETVRAEPRELATRLISLAQQSRRAAGLSQASAELQLHPPDLGRVRVSLSVTEGHVQLNVFAQEASARELIQESIPILASALASVGLVLQEATVDVEQRPSSQLGPPASGGHRKFGEEEAPGAAVLPVAAPWATVEIVV